MGTSTHLEGDDGEVVRELFERLLDDVERLCELPLRGEEQRHQVERGEVLRLQEEGLAHVLRRLRGHTHI